MKCIRKFIELNPGLQLTPFFNESNFLIDKVKSIYELKSDKTVYCALIPVGFESFFILLEVTDILKGNAMILFLLDTYLAKASQE